MVGHNLSGTELFGVLVPENLLASSQNVLQATQPGCTPVICMAANPKNTLKKRNLLPPHSPRSRGPSSPSPSSPLSRRFWGLQSKEMARMEGKLKAYQTQIQLMAADVKRAAVSPQSHAPRCVGSPGMYSLPLPLLLVRTSARNLSWVVSCPTWLAGVVW